MTAKPALVFSLIVAAWLAFGAPAAAVPLTAPGIAVSGSGSHFFKVCSTCPNEGAFDSDSQGGDFVGAAETSGFADPYYGWLASGVLTGPNSLPVLKARAEAEDPSLTLPDVGIGYTSATATAQGLQEYHYAGTEAGTYTITFQISGEVFGDGESIFASLTVYGSDYDPYLEGEFQNTRIAGALFSSTTTSGAFSDSRTITFDIGPGEDFYVLATLSANAFFSDAGSLAGVADASHTFEASFTAGDVSLLSPVPEPGTASLALLGFAALAGVRRVASPRAARLRADG